MSFCALANASFAESWPVKASLIAVPNKTWYSASGIRI